MPKLQRHIDPITMEQSKERTIHTVMDQIEQPHHSFSIKYILRPAFFPALILIFALVIIFNGPSQIGPIDNNDDIINAYTSEKLAEISYISSSFIGSTITVSNPIFQFLADTDETEFETENDTINLYFDTLRVFLNDDFSSLVTYEELVDQEYDYLITFDVNEHPYEFYISLDGETITGILMINQVTYNLTGSLVIEDDETTFVLRAINGADFVNIEYKTESEDEVNTKYTVQSRINNVEKEQEITVSHEENEQKVEIHDGDNEYTLKQELEDGVVQYKLEYKINDTDGEAIIIETTGNDGVTTYSYQIKEGDIEKDIEKGKPQYNFDDDDDDENPGNSTEDPGNNDNSPGNQDTNYNNDFVLYSL